MSKQIHPKVRPCNVQRNTVKPKSSMSDPTGLTEHVNIHASTIRRNLNTFVLKVVKRKLENHKTLTNLTFSFIFPVFIQDVGNVRGTSVTYAVKRRHPSVSCVPTPTATSTVKACSSSPSWTESCAAVNTTPVGQNHWNQGRSGNISPNPDA